jgi:predicted  nucleic acid-binding Zn-ribbon protein
VPITDNICLGCFIRQPTSGSTDHESLRNCENCKRFLYELKV